MRRWTRPSRLYLLASLALAAGAALIVHSYAGRLARATDAMGNQVLVVVAAAPIQRGATVRSGQVRVAHIPQAYAAPGSFKSVSLVAGRVALSDLSPGEAVTETRLARVRAGPVASLVPQGLRAFAVPTSLPAGAVVPGDHVDVLATFGSGEPHTETVVEGVEVLFVLGTGSGVQASLLGEVSLDAAGAGATTSATLMVLVSPDQQERLAYARSFGNLEVTIEPA